MGGAGEGAPAASCSTETAFGLGSLSSKLVDPHLGSSQNWFRKRRLQMNFINLNCDNSLTRALPCTPRGLSYMSREGSNIGLTRPASPPHGAVRRLTAPSSGSTSTSNPALVPLPLCGESGRSSRQAQTPGSRTPLRSCPGCFLSVEAARAPSPPRCRVGLPSPGQMLRAAHSKRVPIPAGAGGSELLPSPQRCLWPCRCPSPRAALPIASMCPGGPQSPLLCPQGHCLPCLAP